MRALALAAVAAVFAGQAGAAVYRYDFEGPITQGEYGDIWGQISITIDEALYPGGSVASSELALTTYDWWWWEGLDEVPESAKDSVTVRRGSDEILVRFDHWALVEGPDGYPGWSIVDYGWEEAGIIYEGEEFPLFGSVYTSGLRLTFDQYGQVYSWGGSCTCGGSADPYISGSVDTFGPLLVEGEMRHTGKWVRTTLSEAPAPVPLPAGIFLLAAPVLAGAAFGRRLRP